MTLPLNDPRDYAARIFARYGIDTQQPGSIQRLADLECKAMYSRLQTSPGAQATRLANMGIPRQDPAFSSHDKAITAILATGPATARDVARVLGLHLDTARDHLRRLTQAQRIKRERVSGTHIYSAMEKAA